MSCTLNRSSFSFSSRNEVAGDSLSMMPHNYSHVDQDSSERMGALYGFSLPLHTS